ncbi:MAG: hypothetical protein D6743_07130 [Calditrichaeota bacterium]|nr:MAG: hypothetical protein D6743_07130 [Calditrichota bacterium]
MRQPLKRIARLAFLLVLASALPAQTLSVKLGKDTYVDWRRRVVRATGRSLSADGQSADTERVQVLEKAKEDALKNLLAGLHKLTVDSHSDLSQALQRRNIPFREIQDLAQYYTVVDVRSMSDNSVEVDIELPIEDKLADRLLPRRVGRGTLHLSDTPLCPVCAQPWPEGRPVPEDIHLIVPSEGFTTSRGEPYSSVIIDARGLKLAPGLFPRVVDEAGKEIYGVEYVDRAVAEKLGLVAYHSNLAAAFKDRRAGSEPLVIRARRVAGPNSCDVVVSNNDALLIHAAAKVHNFLRTCRVIFVLG